MGVTYILQPIIIHKGIQSQYVGILPAGFLGYMMDGRKQMIIELKSFDRQFKDRYNIEDFTR